MDYQDTPRSEQDRTVQAAMLNRRGREIAQTDQALSRTDVLFMAASLMEGWLVFVALVQRFGEHRGFVLTVQWDVLRSTAKRTASDLFGTCLPRSVKDLMV